MNNYSYLHNLKRLDEASYNERSGRPFLTCDGDQLEEPIFDNITPCVTRKIIQILSKMIEGMREFREKNPSLFQISQPKEETPQSIKIKKILIWAGIDISQTPAMEFMGLYQTPKKIHLQKILSSKPNLE